MALPRARTRPPKRQLDSVVLHFDYDCFYASVFENETPSLRTLPLAVQQKQIVVTCNYEARRRGLYKLQLISEAKRICPDVVIVLGEDLTRFRNASKELYAFLRSFSWNARCERLGFDEVFLDVSDIIEYNAAILNPNHLRHSFFCLSRLDPTVGFTFDATQATGHTYPDRYNDTLDGDQSNSLHLRLCLASHLAQHLRGRLEAETGYTATVGISTNKVLAKLVGNLHKPNAQTTLLPPYVCTAPDLVDNVTSFMDELEVGKIPGVGFKIAQKIRTHVLQRPAEFNDGLVYGGTRENVLVRHVRQHPNMSPESLERLLSGSGVPSGIGLRIWELINGCDTTEIGQARETPTQISIEDSYMRLDTLNEVGLELRTLATSLLKRMHTDLLEVDDDEHENTLSKRWLAHPRNIRLSTRPRPPQNPNGSRNRSFARISKSSPMPGFVFSLKDDVSSIVEKLVTETLLPLFHRLHPAKEGWNLSLMNVAAVNISNAASEKGGVGRDIAKMFKRQDDVLKPWKVTEDVDATFGDYTVNRPYSAQLAATSRYVKREGSEDMPTASQESSNGLLGDWNSEEEKEEDVADVDTYYRCEQCGGIMPLFAMGAHERFHGQS
ncbi:hypothetical protein BKA63DRAFT_511511 [Paraphoma chrysanthemicola]|nr:hypothetical protein BKA63DRAFT_511511 [Paraphoma chrysanthemicola]